MGKKRIVKKTGQQVDQGLKARSLAKALNKKKVTSGTLYIESTYNNTKVTLADNSGNALAWSSSGALGFKGAKKGTPFAAAKIGDLLGEKAFGAGIKDVHVIIKGVGSGRESVVRSFMAHSIEINSIKDRTPVPHNGPKPKKPRRI
jgi:small subunit ribosomal protein S11